mgnify:CR=1 FL=1
MLLSFYCLMPYISMGLYSADKKFYLSDASSQLYRPLAYYLAKVHRGKAYIARARLPGAGRECRRAPVHLCRHPRTARPGAASAKGPILARPCLLLNPGRSPPPPLPPPLAPQISAITPFQIVSACVFGFTVYGMGGLRHGYEPVLKNGLINTLMYLIASQVGAGRCGSVAGSRLVHARHAGRDAWRLCSGLPAASGPAHCHSLHVPHVPLPLPKAATHAASPPDAPLRPLQVLHCCAVFAPNQDVAFMMSILWTTIQLLLSGFFVNFPEVRRRELPRAGGPPASGGRAARRGRVWVVLTPTVARARVCRLT